MHRSHCLLGLGSITLFTLLSGGLEAKYELVWSDHFAQADGSAPAAENWVFDIGWENWGWGNGEAQYYTDSRDNVRIQNEHLIIEMHDVSDDPITVGDQTLNYTSGRIKTKGLHSWTYGKFVARIRLPHGSGNGLWPAFWMLGANIDEVIWPNCGEIDIMEYFSKNPDETTGALHGPGYSGGSPKVGEFHHGGPVAPVASVFPPDFSDPNDPVYSTDFHIYSVEWEPEEIRWYVDGHLFLRVNRADVLPDQWAFNHDQFILLNFAAGGIPNGFTVDPSLTFPTQMIVDYVEVYKDTSLTFPVVQLPGRAEAEDFTRQFGTQMITTSDSSGGMELTDLKDGDWIEYTVNAAKAGVYAVDLRLAKGNDEPVTVTVASTTDALESPPIGSTGGWQFWQTTTLGEIALPAGESLVRVTVNTDGADALRINWLQFSGPALVDDFESGVANSLDINGNLLGFIPFKDDGSSISIVAAPSDRSCASGHALTIDTDVAVFSGVSRNFANAAGDTWSAQDWSAYHGVRFWLHGSNSGTEMFFDILENRAPGSVVDDAERFTFPLVDNFAGWRLVEIPFASFVRKASQPANAPDDGFTLTAVHGWAIGSTASGGPITYSIDELQLYLDPATLPSPRMQIVASSSFNDVDGSGFASAGDTISYTYTLTNSGNSDLTGLNLVDTVASVSAAGGASPNLLQNGNFESGDLTGWTGGAGSAAPTPGTPPWGPPAGSFSLLLNGPGSNFPSVFQSLPASEGEAFELSGYLYAQSAPTNGSFGLLKIVFKDDQGTDLPPASVTAGQFADAQFPGAESLPFLDAGNAASGWVFTQAAAVAPPGTASVAFFAIVVDLAATEIYFDEITATRTTAITLAAGQSDCTTFNGVYTLSAADVAAGQVVNSTTASSAEGGPASASLTTLLPVDLSEIGRFVVINTDNSGPGSLRDAVSRATGSERITFHPSLDGATIRLTTGQLQVSQNDLTIDASALPNGVILSGNSNGDSVYQLGETRHFEILANAYTILRGLHLVDGFADNGGSILNNGSLIATDCTFARNTATGDGGAIASSKELHLTRCVLEHNTAAVNGGAIGVSLSDSIATFTESTLRYNTSNTGNGGAIEVKAGSLGVIIRSLLHDNTGKDGGAIAVAGQIQAYNSTLTRNTARGTGMGGAIFNFDGTVFLSNATVVENTAGEGGGIAVFFGGTQDPTVSLERTIVANNTATTHPNIDPLRMTGTDNFVDQNPLLAPLGDYGGPTYSMLPLPGSPVINQGPSQVSLSADQRGFSRVLGGAVDLGAVESGNTFAGSYVVTTTADTIDGMDNDLSLREALTFAPAGATITFDPTLDGMTIALQLGHFAIARDITIDATNLPNRITISGNSNGDAWQDPNESRHFAIFANTSLTLAGLNLVDGVSLLGGSIVNSGTLSIAHCTLSGNIALDSGGAIFNHPGSTTTIVDSTIEDNQALWSGGGIANFSDLNINRSIIRANFADHAGGGIYHYLPDTQWGLRVENSLIAANSAGSQGGGIHADSRGIMCVNSTFTLNTSWRGGGMYLVPIFSMAANTRLIHCTLTGNTANSADDLYVDVEMVEIENSILAIQSPGSVIATVPLVISGNNLTDADPQLLPLGNYGGPTPSMPPIAGSPAIDAATFESALAVDQRLLPRAIDGDGDGIAVPDIGAVESLAGARIKGSLLAGAEYDLTGAWLAGADLRGADLTRLDLSGADLTGAFYDAGTYFPAGFDPLAAGMRAALVVQHAGDGGPGSLRELVATAPTDSLITFAPDLAGATIALFNGQLLIDKAITINGMDLESPVSISGNSDGIVGYVPGETRHFQVAPGGDLTLRGLSLIAGFSDFGGSILNSGTLQVFHTTFFGNTALNNGGAIEVGLGATARIHASTFHYNNAAAGGAISLAGTVELTHSTLVNNTARDSGLGGAIYSFDGHLDVTSTTITQNTAPQGGGIAVFYGGSGSSRLTSTIVAANTAASGPNLSGLINVWDYNYVSATDPMLAPLGDYGGRTPTRPPLHGSPVIDGGGTTTFAADQRGFIRSKGAAVDIGATETSSWELGAAPVTITVTTAGDGFDGLDTNGISLREAMELSPAGSTIRFADLGGSNVYVNQGPLTPNRDLVIDGSNYFDLITLNGAAANGIFDYPAASPSINLTLKGLRLINAFETALRFGSGQLTVELCQFSGNFSIAHASAIYVLDATTLISRSAFYNNVTMTTSLDFSAAIYNQASQDFRIVNSTIANNTLLAGSGAAVFTDQGLTEILHSTIVGNSAPDSQTSGGVAADPSRLDDATTLVFSIVSGNGSNASNPDFNDSFVGSFIGGNPMLLPLDNHGGPLPTMPPIQGSPAIDAIVAPAAAVLMPYDQRMLPRIIDGNADGVAARDLGAVESLEGARITAGDLDAPFNLDGVSLANAQLRGSDLSRLQQLTGANLTGAIYDSGTAFPSGFNPETAGMLGLFSAAELTALRDAARQEVINDPAFYALFTTTDMSLNRQLGQQDVTSNPGSFGLFDESNIQDLAFGRILIKRDAAANEFVIAFSVEASPNFQTQPFEPLPFVDAAFSEPTGKVEIRVPSISAGTEFYRLGVEQN